MWYVISVGFLILFLVILFGAGVFRRLDSADPYFLGGEGWELNEPQPTNHKLSDDCIWHIKTNIKGLETQPANPSEVGVAVYEALSEWISLQYQEETSENL
jgi:hypothetical protein